MQVEVAIIGACKAKPLSSVLGHAIAGALHAREGGDEERHLPAHVLYLTWRSNGFDPTLDSPSNHSKFLCLRTGAE